MAQWSHLKSRPWQKPLVLCWFGCYLIVFFSLFSMVAGFTSGHQRRTRPGSGLNPSSLQPRPPLSIFAMSKNRHPFRHQIDMRNFVECCVREPDVDEVVFKLGDRTGNLLEKLREILQSNFQLDAGRYGLNFSFQRIIVPLLKLLTSPAVQNSPNRRQMENIYETIYAEKEFFPRVLSCLETIASRKTFEDSRASEPLPHNMNWTRDFVLPACNLMLTMLSKVTDGAADSSAESNIDRLSCLLKNWPASRQDSRLVEQANIYIDRCRTLVRQVNRMQQAFQADLITPGLRRKHFMKSFSSSKTTNTVPVEGPGELCPGGPRHDNDKILFRDISILPTQEEVLCDVLPYLPVQGRTQQQNSPEEVLELSRLETYLDTQFRLTREDMLEPLRDAVKSFIEEKTLQKMPPKASGIEVKTQQKNSDTVHLDVYRNVRFCGLFPHFKIGVCVRVEFDAPERVASMKEKERKIYWEFLQGSKRLQQNTIVCVFSNIDGRDCLRFAVIMERNIEHLTRYQSNHHPSKAGQRCSIDLQMLDFTPTPYANWMGGSSASESETILLQPRGHFFASYNSVLNALKHHSLVTLPFQRVIVGSEPAADLNEEFQELGSEAPAYVNSDTRFNLAFLLNERSSAQKDSDKLHDVPIHDFEALRDLLHECSSNLILDSSQIDAFASALSTSISLIQGPPALLHNEGRLNSESSSLLPILCICYTNHALDQFLEDLVENGLSLTDVVRIGSRSRSEMLQERALSDLVWEELTKSERFRFSLLKKNAADLQQEIEERMREATNNPRPWSWNSIKEYVESAYPQHYVDLFDFGGDHDGFEIAGDRQKVHERVWHKWRNGADLRHCIQKGGANQKNAVNRPSSFRNKLSTSRVRFRAFEIDDEVNDIVTAEFAANAIDPASDRALEELLSGDISMRSMSKLERHKLVRHWSTENIEAKNAKIESLVKRYEGICEDLRAIDASCSSRVLSKHKVVGCTTSGGAKHQAVLQRLGARVVVCEEAGEVFESHLIASLTGHTQQLILIGDHLQLRPKPNSYTLSRESGRGYDLDVSLFERLVSQKWHPPQAFSTLLSQRRMRPQISEILRRTLYPKLEDAGSVGDYPDVRGTQENLYFLDHNKPESSGSADASYRNEFEARMIVELVKYFSRQGYRSDQVAVLTPYSGQLLHLRDLLLKENMMLYFSEGDIAEIEGLHDGGDKGKKKVHDSDGKRSSIGSQSVRLKDRIRLATVDNFQGEEADVVIVSTVRCNPHGRVGFLKIDNRVNVMLSRARYGMFLLGSKSTIRNSKTANMFHTVLDYLESENLLGPELQLRCSNHGYVTKVSEVSHFQSVRDGGCDRLCQHRLACGHVCRRRCHPDDKDHKLAQCREPCSNTLDCGHPCPRLCFEKCGGCQRRVEFALDCGHKAADVVCVDRHLFRCRLPVSLHMPLCEHMSDSVPCWKAQKLVALQGTVINPDSNDAAVTPLQTLLNMCTSKCDKLLACGHPCTQTCGACTRDSLNLASSSFPFTLSEAQQHDQRSTHAGRCQEVCDRDLFCGHRCRRKCCQQGSCPPCTRQCRTKCRHSECPFPCSKSCPSCVYPCVWRCKHVGSCPLPCASPCIRLPCDRRCDLRLETCGHRCPSLCGELCPSSEYCRECYMESDSSGAKANAVVDMIEMKTLIEHDPDDSPLLVLPCDHVYTTETLDGFLNLESVYKKSDDSEHWSGTLSSQAVSERQSKPNCPDCREPIQHVRRYGRVFNALALDISEKKFLCEQRSESNVMRDRLRDIQSKMCSIHEKRSPSPSLAEKKFNALFDELGKIEEQCVSNWKNAKISPTQRCFATERLYWNSIDSGHDISDCASSRDHQRTPMRNQAPCYWLKLRVEVFEIRIQFLRLLAQTPKKLPDLELMQAIVDNSIESVTTLEASYEELELHSSLQDARLLAARVFMEIIKLGQALRFLPDEKTKTFARSLQELSKKAMSAKIKDIKAQSLTNQQQNEFNEIEKRSAEIDNDQERRMVFHAMASDIGSGVGSFGGHWYTCPNGHIYTIGECGGATQTSVCIECKAPVGGTQHRVIESNAVATDFVAAMQTNSR